MKHKLQLVWVTELLCPQQNEAVKEATVLFAKSNKGVDYASLDGQPTDLFFMIAAPEGANDTHLAALAELSVQV